MGNTCTRGAQLARLLGVYIYMYVHVPEIQTNGSSALYLLRDA